MPRYFFNVKHDGFQRDHDGHDLPDRHAAWKEATVTAGQVLQVIDGSLKPGHDWEMEITDEIFKRPLSLADFRSQAGQLNDR